MGSASSDEPIRIPAAGVVRSEGIAFKPVRRGFQVSRVLGVLHVELRLRVAGPGDAGLHAGAQGLAAVGRRDPRGAVHLHVQTGGVARIDHHVGDGYGIVTVHLESQVVGAGHQHPVVVAHVQIGIDLVVAPDHGHRGLERSAARAVGHQAADADQAGLHVGQHRVAVVVPVDRDVRGGRHRRRLVITQLDGDFVATHIAIAPVLHPTVNRVPVGPVGDAVVEVWAVPHRQVML